MMWYSGASCSLKSQINTVVPTVQNFCLGKCTEKSYRTESICVYLFILLSFLWSMLWNIEKDNLLILKRLHKSEQRINVILKSDFFVQFRVFYNKEFTRQKKVTNKLIKSVRCIVIAKRGESWRSAIWDSNGCVSMWWYI